MSSDLQPLSPREGVRRFIQHREPSVRESTIRNAKTRLRFFLDWCDEREIENLNTLSGRDMADFVAWRRGDIKAITLQKQLSTIRMALRYWDDIEGVDDGLAEKVHAPELPDGSESKDVHIKAERAEAILSYLNQYQYASRDHVVLLLLWRTGMRRGALVSLDVDDLRPDDTALVLEHRIEEGTKLKNGEAGNRWVYLRPAWYQVVEDYVNGPRVDVKDDYGRRHLLTTRNGRPDGNLVYKWVTKLTLHCTTAGVHTIGVHQPVKRPRRASKAVAHPLGAHTRFGGELVGMTGRWVCESTTRIFSKFVKQLTGWPIRPVRMSS